MQKTRFVLLLPELEIKATAGYTMRQAREYGENVKDTRVNGRTDRRSYRDAWAHFKKRALTAPFSPIPTSRPSPKIADTYALFQSYIKYPLSLSRICFLLSRLCLWWYLPMLLRPNALLCSPQSVWPFRSGEYLLLSFFFGIYCLVFSFNIRRYFLFSAFRD